MSDAFGNALGNSLVKRVSDYQEDRLRETEKLSQNMAAIDAELNEASQNFKKLAGRVWKRTKRGQPEF